MARKSAAGIVALICVPLTYVVVSSDVTLPTLTHCTTEQGRRLVPVTVTVSAGLPAAAVDCDSELIEGVASAVDGVEMVKGKEPDDPIEFVTVTDAVPGNAAWTAEMGAVNCVALTNVVVCAAPFQFTTALLVKFVPFTVSVKPWELQYGVEAAKFVEADSEVIDGNGPGAVLIVKRTILDTSVVVVLLTLEVAD